MPHVWFAGLLVVHKTREVLLLLLVLLLVPLVTVSSKFLEHAHNVIQALDSLHQHHVLLTAGQYISAAGGCTACPANCAMCNANGCMQCSLGSYLASGTCTACFAGCNVCLNNNICQVCIIGFVLLANGTCVTGTFSDPYCQLGFNTTKCVVCIPGYTIAGQNCAACPQNCGNCTTNTTCLNCTQGFNLSLNGSCYNSTVNQAIYLLPTLSMISALFLLFI